MNHMPVIFVYDAPCDEIYCATNVSEFDALEIAGSAIEENGNFFLWMANFLRRI